MRTSLFIASGLLAAFVAGSPTPAQNQPITDAEWQALRDAGLTSRDAASVNVPITTEEMEALRQAGLLERSLDARDKKVTCGHKVTGKGGHNGNGHWIPVEQFKQKARSFCNAFQDNEISKGHETSETYPITLTNQKKPKEVGPDANIVFAVYNIDHDGPLVITEAGCYDAMVAPIADHLETPVHDEFKLAKRGDECYGKKNHDYEGGYWKVDGGGVYGSEIL